MSFTKLLPLLLVFPLTSYAAKKPKKSKPLPACLQELNDQSDPLIQRYKKLSQYFPFNERRRPIVYDSNPDMGLFTDQANRRILAQFLDRWFADQRGWRAWDLKRAAKELKHMGDFPLIAGIITVERDGPTEHMEATIGFHTDGGPQIISRSFIGIVDHFDAKDNRVYVRELEGTNEGNIVSIDITSREFVANLRKAPKRN